jgi:hypothetical protein
MKHVNKYIVLCFFVIALKECAHAQVTVLNSDILRQKFNCQVKQLSQFIDRFNYDEPVQPEDHSSPGRAKNIAGLFNSKDTLLTGNPKALEFLNFVSNDSNRIKLAFYDTNWFAVANCSFTYDSKDVGVDIFLKMENYMGNKGYQWIITGVKSKLFEFTGKVGSPGAFINPMNHELNFTELSRALDEKSNLHLYTAGSYQPDVLSIFLFLVQKDILHFKQINSTEFRFLQVPKWKFTVKNFNRTDYNSGWLISEISKTN